MNPTTARLKSILIGMCLILGVLSIVYFSVGFSKPRQAASGQVAFTVEYSEISTSTVTGRSGHRDLYFAQRGDGAQSNGQMGNIPLIRVVIDPRNKQQVTVSDFTKLKSTEKYSSITATYKPPKITSTCTSTNETARTFVSEDAILGQRALHYWAKPKSSPDGSTLERHVWLSPDLGCYEIKNIAYRYENGRLTVVFEKSPARVIAGEPDPSLFAVPESYKEVKPSELMTAIQQQRVREKKGYAGEAQFMVPLSVQQRWGRLDDSYKKLNDKNK